MVVFERLLCLVLLCSHGRHPNVAKNTDERRGTSSSPSSSSPSSPSSSSSSLSSSSSSRRVGFVLSRRIRGENVCRCVHPLFTWLQRGQPRESHRVGLAREQPVRVYAPRYQRQGHVSSAESTSMVDGSILLVSQQPSLDSRSRMLNFCRKSFPCRRFIPLRPLIEATRRPLLCSKSVAVGSILERYVDRHLKLRGVAGSEGSRGESFRSYREKLTLSWVKFRPRAFSPLKIII